MIYNLQSVEKPKPYLGFIPNNISDELDGRLSVLHECGLVERLGHYAVPVAPVVHGEGVAAQGLEYLVCRYPVGGPSVLGVTVEEDEDTVLGGELLNPQVSIPAAAMSLSALMESEMFYYFLSTQTSSFPDLDSVPPSGMGLGEARYIAALNS